MGFLLPKAKSICAITTLTTDRIDMCSNVLAPCYWEHILFYNSMNLANKLHMISYFQGKENHFKLNPIYYPIFRSF
ncbi:hypothetical protein BK763_25670 [Bacillus thuringiensis serovar thompsoni]|uniref:Uncharacterized protein n=1 Tax=Bacillus thuringiensis TaxID=1428 RepID=A0A9X6V8K5_BACTU|nr:hypothetical protein [Bacillus thuringiensis]OTZ27588.1 hypothetical protein BK763_25670 [Bacillus thuringiensis serovar thompsoni]PFA97476.1 hypothetical protein CN398_21370 [Bacillus thuringiensis]